MITTLWLAARQLRISFVRYAYHHGTRSSYRHLPANTVRSARRGRQHRRPDLAAERILLEQLREQQDRPLRVAIIGEFSTGKSTFINAVLGQDLLPARYLPTTRQLMCICHGESPGQVSVAVNANLAETQTADSADDAPTVWTSETAASLRETAPPQPLSQQAILDLAETSQPLQIRLPIPVPWSNFHIYDTPGVNDATSMAESVIFDLMDQVDVVIMMLRAQQALTASESDFLSHLVRHKDLDKFFFSINFCDSKAASEAASVRAYVVETLGELRNWPMQSLTERIFLCSALPGGDPRGRVGPATADR